MAARRPLERVYVVGVGMTPFSKPGKGDAYPEMGKMAVQKALFDAGVRFDELEHATVGYCYGDSTCGQRVLYELGQTTIPIANVNNNCSTGSTALLLSKQLVAGGVVGCALALGFEQMQRGSLKSHFDDRVNPMDKHVMAMAQERGMVKAPMAAQFFGNAGLEYCEKHGVDHSVMAKIAQKNHRNSANNPYSQFRDIYSLEQIMAAPKIFGPLTKLQCCPTSDGAAAAVLVSESFLLAHPNKERLMARAVLVEALTMATDSGRVFAGSMVDLAGADMTRRAARRAYAEAGIGAGDVQVVEMHDCFSANELISYDALGLCAEGKAGEYVERGDNDYGGKGAVVNCSGGLISKGHPLGATGLAQLTELCWQLRGMAGQRQVPNVRHALQHNVGLGGACVVGIYALGFPQAAKRGAQYDDVNPAVTTDMPAGADDVGGSAPTDVVALPRARL